MKKLLRLLAIFIFLFTSSQSEVYAQKKSRVMQKADVAFNLEEYSKAAELYKKAYQKTKNRAIKAEIIFKQAECYRMSGNIKRAQKVFDEMYLQYGSEYEHRTKERGAVLDSQTGQSMYDLYTTKNHKSITTVLSLYFSDDSKVN